MAEILFFIDVRVYLNNGRETFAFPVCLTIDNPQDEDIAEKSRFIKYVFSIVREINDVNNVVYLDINIRDKGGNVCEVPLWMQAEREFYFSRGVIISKEESKVRVVENKGQGIGFIKDYHVFPNGQYPARYGTITAAKNAMSEWFKSMSPESVNIYVVNSYNQLSEMVYYDSIYNAFYSITFPTIVEITMREKVSNLFLSVFFYKAIKTYIYPLFAMSYVLYGVWLGLQFRNGVITAEDLTRKINFIRDNTYRKTFFIISTILYVIIIMAVFGRR